jgi:hypothetical protein
MRKLHRTPYRCRGCHNRFYVYIPPEKDENEATVDADETRTADPNSEAVHNPDVAKPAGQ